MDDQMFRTVMRGFDKDEVFAYIKKVEAEASQRVAQARAEVIEKDRQIAELKQRIQYKNARYERLENEIEVKYRTYIDNYERIGSLVYESQVKGDQIIENAQREAARLSAESRAQYDRTVAEADLAAQNRLNAVQGEIDAKLGEAKKQYAKIQEDMNEIVDLINEAQRRFMRAYKEVHAVVQRMPIEFDDPDAEKAVPGAEAQAARKKPAITMPAVAGPSGTDVIDDDLDDFDVYDDSDFDAQGVRFSFSDFEVEDDDEYETPVPVNGNTIDYSRVGMPGTQSDYSEPIPFEQQAVGSREPAAMKKAADDEPNYDFSGAFEDEEIVAVPFADEGTFRLPGEKI